MLKNKKKSIFWLSIAILLSTGTMAEAKNAKPSLSIKSKAATTFSVGVTQKKLRGKKTRLSFLLRGGDDDYSKLLLHFNGANGSNSLNNECKKPLAGRTIANNSVTISTDQSKFGGASALFNGTNSYISLNDHEDWNFSGGVWSVDTWIRVNSLTGERTIFSQATDASNNLRGFVKTDGSLSLTIENAGVATSLSSDAGKITANNWHHVAFIENGNDYFLFVDGIKVASLVSAVRPANLTGYFVLGYTDLADETAPFSGYLDEFRLSKGKARWTNNFALAQKAFGYSETIVKSSKKLSSKGKGTISFSDLLPATDYSIKASIRKNGEKSKRNSSYSKIKTLTTDSN